MWGALFSEALDFALERSVSADSLLAESYDGSRRDAGNEGRVGWGRDWGLERELMAPGIRVMDIVRKEDIAMVCELHW